MTQIIINHQRYDVDGIVFDKDGTLIDFHTTWGPILRQAVEDLVESFDDKQIIANNVFKTLGVDRVSMQASDGPYAIATLDKIYTVVTTVLYQHGMKWTQAESHVNTIFKKAAETPPPLELLTPTAQLPNFFQTLQEKGLNVGIATADNRHGTLDTLQKLGCETESLFIACGDDEGLPSKPDPELLDVIADHWGTTVNRIAMVGDTVGDVHMAKSAGAISIGVLTGAGTTQLLSPYCHAVLDSIEQIQTL